MAMFINPYVFGTSGGTTLKTGLVAWWDLEEASGTRADAHGSWPLSVAGTMTNAAARTGNGSVSAGSGSYLQNQVNPPNFSTGDFTVAGLFKTAASNYGIIGIQDNNGTSGRQWIILLSGGAFYVGVSSDGSTHVANISTGTGWNDNVLHDYIAWRDTAANLLCCSIDGGSTVSVALSGSTALKSPANVLTLHGLGGAAIYNDAGTADATALWNRMLTPTERSDLRNGGAWRSYATL